MNKSYGHSNFSHCACEAVFMEYWVQCSRQLGAWQMLFFFMMLKLKIRGTKQSLKQRGILWVNSPFRVSCLAPMPLWMQYAGEQIPNMRARLSRQGSETLLFNTKMSPWHKWRHEEDPKCNNQVRTISTDIRIRNSQTSTRNTPTDPSTQQRVFIQKH